MKNALKMTLITLFLLASSYANDVVKGEKLFHKCMMCHGKDGMGKSSMNAPRVTGKHDKDIVTRLKYFQKEENKNSPMYPFVKNLTEQDLNDLAAYISSMK